ncbi:protein phosphatase 2C domain-containing protein [Streptosporangium sp. NPDC006007]|uniref:protein phosphatase 2C domain-containing protein n=1 Tax=Streptosporangium sp. NPDC006007 TaxID=3154575 RepID=UPI0033B89FF6
MTKAAGHVEAGQEPASSVRELPAPEEAAIAAGPPTFTPPLDYGKPHVKAGKPRGLPSDAIPDTIIDGADYEGLTVRGVSLRGDDHRYNTGPRQDSMGLWILHRPGKVDWLLVCVADGVGSQPLSHRGSALACRLLRDEAFASIDELDHPMIAQRIAQRMAQQMVNAAKNDGHDPQMLSTTLVAALVELTPVSRPRPFLVFGVGDSTAYLLRGGAFQRLLEEQPGAGPISDSGTNALPAHPDSVATAVGSLGDDDMLLVCTDGLVNPMRTREVEEQLINWWTKGPVPGLPEFGWQLSFRAKSYGDDRTAVCVWGR